jgi:uncharacterized tellurite resistance protein B-like protein
MTGQMEETTKILSGYSDEEKGAYLGAIASIATADRSASEQEVEYLEALSEAADLSDEQKQAVVRAAKDLSSDELRRCLEILKHSPLKFSLVADLITFAKVDQDYTAEEKGNVEKIASFLEVDQKQFSLLDQFVNKTATANTNPEQVRQEGFFDSLGLKDQFSKAGINVNSLTKGLLGIVGPMILAKMFMGGARRRPGVGMGSGSPFGMNRAPIPSGGAFGGLGSLFGMLGGRRTPGGMGGILGGLFR